MNSFAAWKKVLLFGLFGAAGCLAGWLVGEPFLAANDFAARAAGAGQGPTLISKPVPSNDPPPPPREFQERLSAAGAKTGDVQISLIWFNTNDLDLHCVDPSGFEIGWQPDRRRSPRTGGELDVDRNAGCRLPTAEPVENIYWAPGRAPRGRYQVLLNFYQHCPSAPRESSYKINVLHGGTRKEFTGTIGSGESKRLVYEFQADPKIELFAPAEFDIGVGATLKVPIGVRREFYPGNLEVRAEDLPAGVTAEPLALTDGASHGDLVLKASDGADTGKKKIKFVVKGEGASASADAELTVAGRVSLWMVLAIGFWTALLALGLCLALVAGQNKYLGKALFASGRVPLVLVIFGALAAGFASGTLGQTLFYVLLFIGASKLGFLIGWVLLGGLLGWGVSFFIPNLDWKKAGLAGLGGGFLGALAFVVLSYAHDILGRFGGAAILGFCIGLMVAVVEVAFRRAWLEVRFSEREVITVNLGTEPVKVGGDSRACTIWARGAADIALRYWVRDGKVYCEDATSRREAIVGEGDTRTAAGVTVVVRTGSTSAAPPPSARPPVPPARPALPPAPPQAARPAAPPPKPVTPAPPPPKPAPAPKPSAATEYDDGLPMPMGPPPPARPGATSILDIDDLRAPVAARPAAPKPAAPAPPAKSSAPAPKPPAPAPQVAKPATPPAPKPPAIAPTGDADACPTCGRKIVGKPGTRYCMVCDKTF